MPTEDPHTKHPSPPYPQPTLDPPGKEREMSPKADHGEESYKGSNKLKGRVALITGREFKYTFETTVHAMFYLCKAALAHLQPGSSIINVASIQAYQPSPNLLAYAATKGRDSTYITGGVLGVTGGRPLS